jgi:RimJ/RimL family protein N-acetyltransferase
MTRPWPIAGLGSVPAVPADYAPMTQADVAEVAAALDDDRVYRYIGGRPPRSEVERGLSRALQGPPADAAGETWWNVVVRDRAGGAVVGRLEATLHDGIAEVAYLYAPSRGRRGLAAAGLSWLHGALCARGVEAAWAATHPENVASVALLERCGYRRVAAERHPSLRSYDDGDLVFVATING